MTFADVLDPILTFSQTNPCFLCVCRTSLSKMLKLKEFAEDNSKFDENGRKFSKSVESTVGKGEIAHNEQFLRFPQCFEKALIADT